MRRLGKLQPLTVAKLTQPGRHGDGAGLYLQIMDNGSKSWLFRFEIAGRERFMGLGPTHTVSLKEAREKARSARQLLLEGRDPLAERQAARAALSAAVEIPTFKEAAQAFFETNEKRWRNAKHRAQFVSTLAHYAHPIIGRLKVDAIDTPDVLRVIEPIWSTKTETADRVRGRIQKVLEWATTRGYRRGDNPARWSGHLANILPPRSAIAKTNHHAALPYADLPEFMAELRANDSISARALEWTILTAARTGATIGAPWSEIDMDSKVWTVPGSRAGTKIRDGQKDHRVPLPDRAVEILKSLPREEGNEHIFIGAVKGSGLSDMAMLELLKGMRPGLTVHGFRSTFKDWAAETTNYPNIVSEMALAHTVKDEVEAAYRRGDLFAKRKRLMADWAKYCARPAVKADNVVLLRRGDRGDQAFEE